MSGCTMNRINHHPHLIVIDGPIGVGKSSVIKLLSEKINALVIPEYIDESDGVKHLNEYLDNKHLYAYDFQAYILNHYREYIKGKNFSDYDYVIMERDPLRGVTFFARMDLNNSYISLAEYNSLFIRAIEVRTDIKEAVGDNYSDYTVTYDTSNRDINNIVNDIIENFLDADEIRLDATPKIIYDRINKRNREGEAEAYDMKYIKYMCQNYYR